MWLLFAVLVGLNAQAAFADDAYSRATQATTAGVVEPAGHTPDSETGEHGLSPKAVEIGRVFGLPVTNSRLVSWVVALGLNVFAEQSFSTHRSS